jgi:predicted aspartyl protease
MTVIGSFNAGCPVIQIAVSGPLTNPTTVTAIVDTGFSGFLLLPILEAFPVGLILRGTTVITLADGTAQTKLTCLGLLHFDGESQVGLIIIENQTTDILVGMDFLTKFGIELVVDPANSLVKLAKSVPLPAAPSPTPAPTIVIASPAPPTAPTS